VAGCQKRLTPNELAAQKKKKKHKNQQTNRGGHSRSELPVAVWGT